MADKKKSLKRKWQAFIYRLRRKRINQNTLTYLVMVLITSIFWFVNKSGSTINTVGIFPVEYYGLPHNSILVPGITTQELKINFSARGMTLLGHHGQYSTIRIDLSKLDIRTFPESDSSLKFVTDDDIRAQVELQMPNEYKFISVKPDTIKLDFGLSSHKRVPVILHSNISFNQQYRQSGKTILQPDSVDISGSAMIVDTIQSITTEELTLKNLNESAAQKVKLILPNGVNCGLQFTDVSINVEKFTENTLEIPIKQVNVPDSVTLRIFSQNVTVRYNVSWNNYKKISKEMFTAIVDYNELTGIVRPKYLPVKISKMPENMGVTNLALQPEAVEYLIEFKNRE